MKNCMDCKHVAECDEIKRVVEDEAPIAVCFYVCERFEPRVRGQ